MPEHMAKMFWNTDIHNKGENLTAEVPNSL